MSQKSKSFTDSHPKVFIRTFGCQMNVHDSEKMAGVLSREGYSAAKDPNEADIIIYNTCSIRQKAEQKFFSELGRIRSIKRKNPGIRIAVAGCIAQQQGEELFKRAPHIDLVFGPQNIHLLGSILGWPSGSVANQENPEIAESDLPVLRKSGGRAWVAVMYGCDNFCSYCIVPFTRGRERSRPSKNIFEEISGLAAEGFVEVTLLGQNVNSYKSDIDFPGLLRRINSIEGIRRIRFVTSHPRDLSDDLIGAMEELEKVCEHIHLPLQSGSDRVLSLMNRGYKYRDYLGKIAKLRSRIGGIAITTDIIAGFPGETEMDHEETKRALREIEFDGIFAFNYSPRPGTSAALMKDHVADEVKSRRLSEILEIQEDITLKINKNLENTIQEVLVEDPGESDGVMLTGRTRSNKIVHFVNRGVETRSLVTVKIIEAKKHSLLGDTL